MSGAENGEERADKSGKRSGAVSRSRKKTSIAKRGAGSRSGNGAVSGDHRNRQNISLRSHAVDLGCIVQSW